MQLKKSMLMGSGVCLFIPSDGLNLLIALNPLLKDD